jgi:hypothetical protein
MKIQSKYLVGTDWLADNLDGPNLVIIEVTIVNGVGKFRQFTERTWPNEVIR